MKSFRGQDRLELSILVPILLSLICTLPAVNATRHIFNATTTNPYNSSLDILGDAACTLGPPTLKTAPDPRPCDDLMNDFIEDYEDFGVMDWGKNVKSRHFPYTTQNSHCALTISSAKPAISEKFSVPDLWDPMFEVFYMCLLQVKERKGVDVRSWWVGGLVHFVGREGHTLDLTLEIMSPYREDGQGDIKGDTGRVGGIVSLEESATS